MKRFRLATTITLAGVMLAAGCASPCGSCGGYQRMSMFRSRRACPCECCSSCGGGVPIVGAGPEFGEGPLLEPPGPPLSMAPPPAGTALPPPFAPSLGAPLGTPAVPADPGRLSPIPNAAPPFPAGPSSRVGR
ncbi:MAG TPA: hypothetical protein VMF69_13650 [Gemmataceae bacterium]|nr:hypothetical protein [Gemmataceae bacterium]